MQLNERHELWIRDQRRFTHFAHDFHNDTIYGIAVSPDGARIASASADKYVRTFDLATGEMIRRYEGHTNYVLGVDWKGDGQTLVSSSGSSVCSGRPATLSSGHTKKKLNAF